MRGSSQKHLGGSVLSLKPKADVVPDLRVASFAYPKVRAQVGSFSVLLCPVPAVSATQRKLPTLSVPRPSGYTPWIVPLVTRGPGKLRHES